MFRQIIVATLIALLTTYSVAAEGLLDGRVFKGMIGPAENPDLADSLHFNDGHFWSDICTKCGFLPGTYTATKIDEGIRFEGTLQSDSRGEFYYDGLVRADGSIAVSIKWERRRWYWTASREIAFTGSANEGGKPITLNEIQVQMNGNDPAANQLCARF